MALPVKEDWPHPMNDEEYDEVGDGDCGYSNCEECNSQNCFYRLLEKNYPFPTTDSDDNSEIVEETDFEQKE